jgi:hypothetical protein
VNNPSPVMENEIITIVVAGMPMRARAANVRPEVSVEWQGVDNDDHGTIPYNVWQKARDAQAALAKHGIVTGKRPAVVNTDAVDISIEEVQRLRAIITQLGNLARSHAYIRAYSKQYSSPYLKICADDLERIRALVKEETGADPESLP